MKSFFFRVILVGALFSFIIPLTSLVSVVHAQSSTTTTIIPPSFELFANPGETLTESISIRNETSFQQVYNIGAENFEANGDTGEVNLVTGGSSSTFSLAQWVAITQNSITITAHTQKQIVFKIAVPNGAEPGGHYGAISIQSAPGDTPGAANVSAGQVSLILLRVTGNVTEKAVAESFTAPSYSEYGPVVLTLKAKNQGDVHIKPQGNIIITDIFGAKVAEFPLSGKNVLPGAERLMATTWSEQHPIGRFTATLVATYGENHKSLLGTNALATTTFVVFPKPLAIGIGIGTAVIILIIISVLSGRKRIAKALKAIAQG